MLSRLTKCNRHMSFVTALETWSNQNAFVSPTQFQRRATLSPFPNRGDYAHVGDDDLKFFEETLGGRVLTDQSSLDARNTDWLKMFKGNSKVILRPKSTVEVSKVLQYCNNRRIAIVPQGGNTGLVGGSVPVFDEVILSLELMNKILHVDQTAGILRCEAGCVLEHLNYHLSQYELMVPLDLGAKGSCHIGGNVSTNAGGLRLLRYGSLHGNVLGLEVVLPDGTILNSMSAPRKDNTGYDLKQLFIGSEGTLGVVTGVSILTPSKPKSINVALLGLSDFVKVQSAFSTAKLLLGEILSAFEFLDSVAINAVEDTLGYPNPISRFPFYVLVETSGSNNDHDNEKLSHLLEVLMKDDIILDGTLAQDNSQIQSIWRLRENVAEAMAREGLVYKYDVSLPLDKLYDLVVDVRKRVGSHALRVGGYGHLGDGNVHINVVSNGPSQILVDKLEPFIYEWTASCSGSISAEHGLGFRKPNAMYYSKSPSEVALMKAIKKHLDPKAILNPYKTLPWR